MKKIIGIGLSLIVPLIVTATAFAAVPPIDSVDIGKPVSEAGHMLFGWGPIEPATHGGGWGGFDTTGENTRVVWYSDRDGSQKGQWACRPDDRSADPNGRSATLILKKPFGKPASKLEMRVLDGIGDDSFKVFVMGKKVFSYTDASTTEVWKTHTIKLNRRLTRWLPFLVVKIVSTGERWDGWCPYGQLAVDWVKLSK